MSSSNKKIRVLMRNQKRGEVVFGVLRGNEEEEA